MKIAVVGIGGVGGYIGAKLIRSSLAQVKFFARQRQRRVIEREGLKIADCNEEFAVRPDFSSLEEGEVFDAVFIATKSYDFKEACKSVEKYTDETSIVIPLANGVGHKETIRKYLKKPVICDGCVYVISNKKRDDLIVKKSPGFFMVFGSQIINEKMRTLAKILNDGFLKSKLSRNARYECWKKYLFISSFATMTSYFNESMDMIFLKRRDLLEEVLTEIKNVANALDVPVNEEDLKKVFKQAENLPLDSKTSMQLDFEKHKETELESLCGYIVKTAGSYGIKADRMQEMYDSLKQKRKQDGM